MQKIATAVVITHASELFGPPDALVDWLNKQSIARLYVLRFPLDIGSNSTLEEVVYGRGIEISHRRRSVKLSGLGQYTASIKQTRNFLRRIIRNHGMIDLLVAANSLNYLGASIALPKKYIKNRVFYSVDYSPKRFNNFLLNSIYRTIDNWSAHHADFTWNVSKRAIDARTSTGVQPDRLIHVPNGVPLVGEVKLEKDPNLIAFVGHLTMTKGLQDLLTAWPEIRQQQPRAKLLIIGSGPDEHKLKNIVKNEGLKGIKFTGQKNHQQTIELLGRATVGVALYNNLDSYTYYCDPMKVREYLAVQAVPVMSNVPEIAEIIHQNGAGEVVATDSHDLAEKIILVLKNPTKYYKPLKYLAQRGGWEEVFANSFKKMGLSVTDRASNRILAVLWNPGEKEISAGGFRRAFEILKRFNESDGQLVVLDSYPSLMIGEAKNPAIRIVHYHIPRFIIWLEKVWFALGRTLNWLYSMLAIKWFGWRLRKQYDVVYVPYSEILVTSFGAGVLKWLTGKRVVYCNENTDSRRWAATINNFIHNHVDRAMTISQDLASDLNKQGIRGSMPINYTGIDLTMLKKTPNQPKKYDAIFIGRHVDTKGIYDYAKMLPAIVKQYPNFKFISVGACTAEMKHELTSMLTEKGVADHWEFKGIVTEKEKYRLIKQSKTVWFLSTMEGWGIVPQEALGCGVLPLCYDIPVYKESIRSCEAVKFVPVGDIKAATRAAKELLEMDAESRNRLTKIGVEFVERFSWDKIARREFNLIYGVELSPLVQEEEKLLKSINK